MSENISQSNTTNNNNNINDTDFSESSNNNNNNNNTTTTTTTTTTTSTSSSNSEQNNNPNTPRQQTSSPPPPPQSQNSAFECNICFDDVCEPVVTQCGHLFCWKCIFQWLQHNSNQQCPVCKAPVSNDKLIPIYGRGGKGEDPREKSQSIPQRPPGRPEQPRPRNRNDNSGFNDFFHSPFGMNGNIGGTGISFGFGLIPGLFGIHFYGNNNNNNNNNNNSGGVGGSTTTNNNSGSGNTNYQRNSMTSEESIFLSRLMFALGLLLLFFVLFN